MAKAANKVVAGDYEGCKIKGTSIVTPDGAIVLDKSTVEEYEVIDEERRKNATSGILRGGAGVMLLGPLGAIAAVSAKNKGIYQLAIQFKDGKRSLIEVDEKIRKSLVRDLF